MKRLARLATLLSAFLAAIWLSSISSVQAAPNFDAIYVFGDSLSDTGNLLAVTRSLGLNPPLPPSDPPARSYYQGRFSNGPNAFEYLWRRVRGNNALEIAAFANVGNLSGNAVSFAFGGAQSGFADPVPPSGLPVPGLLGQIEIFATALAGRRPSRNALYAVWIGANDYEVSLADPNVVVARTSLGIVRLYQLGARRFIVAGVPDISITPLVQTGEPEKIAPLQTLVPQHNAKLRAAVSLLNSSLPGAKIVYVDVYRFVNDVIANRIPGVPPLIPNVPALEAVGGSGTSFCLFFEGAPCANLSSLEVRGFLFWDAEHPTTQAHQLLGEYMYGLLN